MKNKFVTIYLLVFTMLLPVQFTKGEYVPVLDGIISDGEWTNAQARKIRMNNGIDINFKVIYTDTDAYYLVTFPHNSPGDVIVRDPSVNGNVIRHDYFGVEFDVNNDGVVMGTNKDPDDLILIDYDQPGAVDMFSHSYHVYKDEDYSGENNVEGMSNDENGILIYEFRKSLDSKDRNGYDISLKKGDSYYIMIAIWDNKYVGSAAESINLQIDNSLFMKLRVGNPETNIYKEIISGATILIATGVFILFIKKKPVKT